MKKNAAQHMRQDLSNAVRIHFGLKIYAQIGHGRKLLKNAQAYLLKRLLSSMEIQSAQKYSEIEMLPEGFEVGPLTKGKESILSHA